MGSRGKRRSVGQRIGEEGEGLFRIWAAEHSLSAQKVDNDYGIDFYCQVMQRLTQEIEEVTGALLAVQVRTTAGKVKRIRMGRADAESAVRFEGPFAIAGVDLGRHEVRLRFMDQQLAEELQRFLKSKRKDKTWDFFGFEPVGPDFGKRLARVCAPAFQQNLRFAQAQLALAAGIPGARLRFQVGETGGVAVVTVQHFPHAFNVPTEHQARIARIVFDKGALPKPSDKGFRVRPEIQALGRLVNGPTVIVGPLDREAQVTAVAPDGRSASTTVVVRSVGDEVAYVTKTGLVVAFSEPRKRGGQWVHDMRWNVAEGAVVDLGNTADLLFLKCLRPGARMGVGGEQGIPIAHFGSLEFLGEQIEQAEKVLSLLGKSSSGVFLSDVVSRSFSIGASLLTALSEGVGLDRILPGFVFQVEDSGNTPKGVWRRCEFRLPVVLNLANLGVVVWLEGEGAFYDSSHGICGFRTEQQRAWYHELRKPFAQVESPQLWFFKNWPPIPLEPLSEGVISVRFSGVALEFAGEFKVVEE